MNEHHDEEWHVTTDLPEYDDDTPSGCLIGFAVMALCGAVVGFFIGVAVAS